MLDEVEQSGKWPQRACTTKNVRSEMPIALMPSLIRWWEALRAPEVVKWQQTYRVEWDATDDRNGGAQRTEREKIKELWPWSWTWRRPSSEAAFSFPRMFLRVLCGFFEHERRVQFEGCAAEPLLSLNGHSARIQVQLCVIENCVAGCAEGGHKNFPSFEVEVFVDDITALVKGRNKEVAEMAKKVMEKLKEEVEKKGLQLSVTEK